MRPRIRHVDLYSGRHAGRIDRSSVVAVILVVAAAALVIVMGVVIAAVR